MVETETKSTKTYAAVAEVAAKPPEERHPWEDQSLSAKERYDSYFSVVKQHAQSIHAAGTRAGITEDERTAIRADLNTAHWVSELRQLLRETPNDFCYRIDGGMQRGLLGKSFLGPEEWRAQGIDVGPVLPIPASITKELLNLPCPLHPGEKIKDPHLLVLVPKTVNGEPCTPLELNKLCATRKGSGDRLMFDMETSWKLWSFASAPQPASEWVLIPKRDPDPDKVSVDKHFRRKNISEQQMVHDEHYRDYREVKTVELMTTALLCDLVNKERLLPNSLLRCQESNASGTPVCVGGFAAFGLRVIDGGTSVSSRFGRALVRKIEL